MSNATSTAVVEPIANVAGVAVSFVVPAWNEAAHLAHCLRSIADQKLPAGVDSVEVIVVDNMSEDATREVAARAGAKVVSVEPGRASRARNFGARVAHGDWLAFVDADCELPPDWIAICGRGLEAPGVVAIGGTLRAEFDRATWVERAGYALHDANSPPIATAVRWLPGFNLLVRKRDFNAIGGFNESLVTCEDCEFSYRLGDRGKLVVEPLAATAHRGESKTLRQLFRRESWRSQGNLRVALLRPGDWRNWVSLALPVASVIGMIAVVTAAVLALRRTPGAWPIGIAGLAGAMAPFFRVLPSVIRSAPLATWPSVVAVYAVYLAARTVGLFLPANRVAHKKTTS